MLPLTLRAPASEPSDSTPFRFNTGRVRDHWHTMTRTAKSPRLSQHLAEPFVEINPTDAADLGLTAASLAVVENPLGRVILRVLVTDRVQPGSVFAPMHWTAEYASAGRIDALVKAAVDPVSGQPESKASVVGIAPYTPEWFGFAISSREINADCDYWARARVRNGWRAELAHSQTPDNWEDYARLLFDAPNADAMTLTDTKAGTARVALSEGGRLLAAVFVGTGPVGVSRNYLIGQLAQDTNNVLAGRAGADTPDPGATLCSCFNVGVNTIRRAIETNGLISVDAIGEALSAGTNCGSCRPEIAALVASAQSKG